MTKRHEFNTKKNEFGLEKKRCGLVLGQTRMTLSKNGLDSDQSNGHEINP